MSLATQALTAIELARSRHPDDLQVQNAADIAQDALRPQGLMDSGGILSDGLSNCVEYTSANASFYGRTVGYWLADCDQWIVNLQGAFQPLISALEIAGDNEAAETAVAVFEGAGNAADTRNNVTTAPVKIPAFLWIAAAFLLFARSSGR